MLKITLKDNYLDFWYRFVDPARSLVALELGEQVWERTIAPNLHQYISRPAFERACRDYLWRARRANALPADLDFTEVGTWWGAEDKEIDVVAINAAGHVTSAGSCKWTNAPMDVAEYAALLADVQAVASELKLNREKIGTAEGPHLALFSRSGFTPRLEELAAQPTSSHLLLIPLSKLYR